MSLPQIIFMAAQILILTLILVHCAPIMAWVERRGSALMQNRLGPNRLGPLGLFQSLADGVKFIFKEDSVPGHVSKFYYILAPVVSLVPSFLTFAVIPYGSQFDFGNGEIFKFQVADLNVGVLFSIAIASLGIYGIIMAGWASNSKYALLGAMRSSSQMISYELSMGLSLVGILMVFSSVKLGDIAAAQGAALFHIGSYAVPKWGIFCQPIGFLIFFTAIFAETNRLPFDLPEGESEIVAGYHLEYGSMKFAMLQMAEYNNMLTGCGLVTTLYFGGWQMLFPLGFIFNHLGLTGMTAEGVRVAFEIGSFTVKVLFFMWVFVWVRWTLPRFRYDQLMDLGWKIMLPLSLVNLFATAVLIYYGVI
jgi:NADH-quinone oxidoreductase subunit H